MSDKMFSRLLKLGSVGVLLLCFVLVRFYENNLFYDPFLSYFKGDFNNQPLPEYDTFRLVLNLFFRYGINMVISLGMLYVIFKDKMMIQFSCILYAVAFVLLSITLFVVIHIYGSQNNFLLFNIRRFIIQPVFILLFIPAFYFQKRNS